jgi:hypothetical protein
MRRPAFIEIDGKAVPALTGLCRVAAPVRRDKPAE